MPRLFIAIDIPEEIKEDLEKISFGVPGARWLKDKQIHLTLRFLGEIHGSTYLDIVQCLNQIQADDFSLQLKGVGHFPPRKQPRIIWVGVEKNEKLMTLKKKIDQRLTHLDIEPDGRKFYPHISIARLKNTPASRVGRYIQEHNLFKCAPFQAEEFHLFSSTLNRNGAKYKIEASYALNAHENQPILEGDGEGNGEGEQE